MCLLSCWDCCRCRTGVLFVCCHSRRVALQCMQQTQLDGSGGLLMSF